MSVFTTNFPLEVIELIIDCLATQDDKSFSSIKACSLVSRRLLPRARSYIFSSIVIGTREDGGFTSCWNFERLISRTQELARYVTSLHYRVEEDFDELAEDCDTQGLVRALNGLTRLRSLRLSANFRSWKHLTIVKEPILNLMHLPTLTRLQLENFVDFQLSDLTLCVGLKHLNLGCGIMEVGTAIEIYQDQPSRLESFKGCEVHMLWDLYTARRSDGKPIVDITRLRNLCLDIEHDADLHNLQELFKHLTQLTSFQLFGTENLLCPSDFPNTFLPCLQTLRHVYLGMSFSPISLLVSGFASIAGNNIIESIKLSFNFLAPSYHFDDTWNALDQVFTHSESDWKELRSFSITFGVQYYNESIRELQKLPVTALKGLASNKNITLDFEVLSSEYVMAEKRKVSLLSNSCTNFHQG